MLDVPLPAISRVVPLMRSGSPEAAKLNDMAYDAGLADRVRSVLERTCTFSEKKMFGGVAFMVNGLMCCGVVLRLGPDGASKALGHRHTRPMDFTGKPMKSMIYVSAAGTDGEKSLEHWLLLAVRYAKKPSKQATPRREGTWSPRGE